MLYTGHLNRAGGVSIRNLSMNYSVEYFGADSVVDDSVRCVQRVLTFDNGHVDKCMYWIGHNGRIQAIKCGDYEQIYGRYTFGSRTVGDVLRLHNQLAIVRASKRNLKTYNSKG